MHPEMKPFLLLIAIIISTILLLHRRPDSIKNDNHS